MKIKFGDKKKRFKESQKESPKGKFPANMKVDYHRRSEKMK